MGVSSWMARSYADGHGLVFPGSFASASLALRPSGIELSCRDRETIQALMELLRTRPVLLGRLAISKRCQRLAADLHRPAGNLPEPYPLRRRAFDASVVVRRAGLVHPIGGRPFPDDVLASEAELLDRVEGALAGRADATAIDRTDLVDAIRRDYLTVAPWPFQALTDTLGT